jgi:hypothetical protein
MNGKYCGRTITRFLINNRTPAYSDENDHVVCDAHPYTTDPMIHVPAGAGITLDRRMSDLTEGAG